MSDVVHDPDSAVRTNDLVLQLVDAPLRKGIPKGPVQKGGVIRMNVMREHLLVRWRSLRRIDPIDAALLFRPDRLLRRGDVLEAAKVADLLALEEDISHPVEMDLLLLSRRDVAESD